MDTSGLQAVILEFPLPVRTCKVLHGPFELLDLKNVGTDFDIVFLSCLQAEIWVFPVWRPPSWISHFRFGRTAIMLITLDNLTPKTWG